MAPSDGSLAQNVRTFGRERADREYSRKTQRRSAAMQSPSLRHNASVTAMFLTAYALKGRSVDRLFQETRELTQRNEWLDAALAELNDINQEVAEESLPEIVPDTKDQARRILCALATQSITPTVYPTEDGEIALYFKPLAAKSAVLILVGSDGQGACFSYINGKNRRARYDDASELPDVFVREQLRRLADTQA